MHWDVMFQETWTCATALLSNLKGICQVSVRIRANSRGNVPVAIFSNFRNKRKTKVLLQTPDKNRLF